MFLTVASILAITGLASRLVYWYLDARSMEEEQDTATTLPVQDASDVDFLSAGDEVTTSSTAKVSSDDPPVDPKPSNEGIGPRPTPLDIGAVEQSIGIIQEPQSVLNLLHTPFPKEADHGVRAVFYEDQSLDDADVSVMPANDNWLIG